MRLRLLFFVGSFAISSTAISADECKPISWAAPSEREDGRQLPSSEISSYTIFAGKSSYSTDISVDVVGKTSVSCDEMKILDKPGKWYIFGITTDKDGLSSEYSNQITRTIAEPEVVPSPPKKLIMRD